MDEWMVHGWMNGEGGRGGQTNERMNRCMNECVREWII